MNMRVHRLTLAVGFIFWAGFMCAAEKPSFDVATPDKRKALLETATFLAKQHALDPLPVGTLNPFDPTGFSQADADERAAARVAARSTNQTTPARALNDRELLETIASRIAPKGTMFGPGGEPILMLGNKPVKIGAKFTVTYSGVDYMLELTAIDRTTFTLRYNREEIIRPINKAGK